MAIKRFLQYCPRCFDRREQVSWVASCTSNRRRGARHDPTDGEGATSRVGEETVADTADSGEVLGVGGIVFDVAAEADDEVVDGAGVGVRVHAPDLLED